LILLYKIKNNEVPLNMVNGGGGVHHLCWYYWRISKLSHFYHQIYHQM